MVRAMAPSLEPIHELHLLLNQSGLMRWAEISHSYLAMTKESVYSDEPTPLEPRPGADSKYLIVYPMWKRRGWYPPPSHERGCLMRGPIQVGPRPPTIRLNTRYPYRPRRQEVVGSFARGHPGEF